MDWDTVDHFSREEFGEGDPGVEPDEAFVRSLNNARGLAGVKFTITDGLRTTKRNLELGGTTTGSHVTGHGVDIRVRSDNDRYRIILGLLLAGFTRFGVYDNHIHADMSPFKNRERCWVGKSK